MNFILRIAILLTLALSIQACSTVKATQGPDRKDLSVLDIGTDRHRVLAELGKPVVTEKDQNNNTTDVFKFRQGLHGAAKAGKAIGYSLLAVGTFGLSEVVTNPAEGALGKGAEIQLKVVYDASNKVKEVVVLKDGRWIPIQGLDENTAN